MKLLSWPLVLDLVLDVWVGLEEEGRSNGCFVMFFRLGLFKRCWTLTLWVDEFLDLFSSLQHAQSTWHHLLRAFLSGMTCCGSAEHAHSFPGGGYPCGILPQCPHVLYLNRLWYPLLLEGRV